MARINVFDQDTLDALVAQGSTPETIKRVRLSMEENHRNYAQNEAMAEEIRALQDQLAEREPQVAWIIPLSYAEVLHDFLYRNMPGGYQAYHDELREAIGRARPVE